MEKRSTNVGSVRYGRGRKGWCMQQSRKKHTNEEKGSWRALKEKEHRNVVRRGR